MEPIELLREHPHEVQIWLHTLKLRWHPLFLMRHFLALLIQGEDGWREHSGFHMSIRKGDYVVEAGWPVVRKAPAIEKLRKDVVIHAFAFDLPLTEGQFREAEKWLSQQIGKPYDLILFTMRAIATVWRLRKRWWPIVDVTGEVAFICYELVARYINNLTGKHYCSPSRFGPTDLWGLVDAGVLAYRGQVLAG